MNIEKYKKLSSRFENRRFETAYKWTSHVLYGGSILGNLLSIVFAYFFVNTLTQQAAVHFSGQAVILPIFIVLFLTAFELTKRFVFANVVTNFLISKKINGKVISNFLFALAVICLSFWLSMSGAQTYSNKEDQILATNDTIVKQQQEKISSAYLIDINKLEDRIKYTYDAAQERKKKSLTSDEVKQIKLWEEDIKNLKIEKDKKLLDVKQTTVGESKNDLEKTNKGQLAFLLLSAFIEFLILIGVAFKEYYDHSSFIEQKNILESSDNYQILQSHKLLLTILYNNGKIKKGSVLPSMKQFSELVNSGKLNKYSQKSLKEFLALLNYLKITQLSGKTRSTIVDYETAKDILENYLPIE